MTLSVDLMLRAAEKITLWVLEASWPDPMELDHCLASKRRRVASKLARPRNSPVALSRWGSVVLIEPAGSPKRSRGSAPAHRGTARHELSNATRSGF
jgi:hypothetical protein